LEYYFTKERVTEENAGEKTDEILFKTQMKAVFSDRYMMCLLLYFFVSTIGVSFKNISLVYYCNYVLGTYADGITQTMVSVIGGIPMGIGIFIVWPLAKKIGKRNITMAGGVLIALGSAICLINPTNMVIVIIGQFVKNIGGLPGSYVFMALLADTYDHLEWKNRFRVDGAAMSIYSIITIAITGICSGIYNFMLAKTGYVAPAFENGVTIAATQNISVQHMITFCFLGLEIVTTIFTLVLLSFLNVEKGLAEKQAEIAARCAE
jgi:GPH family glycoside/pentoside/hexuronide:cation symporter